MTNLACKDLVKSLINGKINERGELFSYTVLAQIKKEIDLLRTFLPGINELTNIEYARIYLLAENEFLSVNPIEIDPSISLTKANFKTWLTEERKQTISTDYIDRYISYLTRKGRSQKVIQNIEVSSENILSKLGDPKSDIPFYIKGLVVGSVQSGKTGNFNAVINRSIDTGYSLIIVLSGIMEDLRSQTQLRIEEEVVGEGTVDIKKGTKGDKGVGNENKFGEQGDQTVRQVFSITSYKSDFKKSVKETDFSLNNKNILVCKKNPGVLKNLLIWLSEYLTENKEKHNISLLIVDDEADNASLNNLGKKGKEFASIINGHIRAILYLFNKKSYLGYTATPFANVLQDRNGPAETKWRIKYKTEGESEEKLFGQVDNLFPDDFIELLKPPSNYVGPKQIFETVQHEGKKLPLVEIINDTDEQFPAKIIDKNGKLRATTKSDVYPVCLPRSLEDAIQCFILSIALRYSRVSEMTDSDYLNPHHTMLVHISRFITWQNRTKILIVKYLDYLQHGIDNDSHKNRELVYGNLERTWNKYYATIVQNIINYLPEDYKDMFLTAKSYAEVRPHLVKAISEISVKAANSDSDDKLIYNKDFHGNGQKIIAVGGNRLSRGFTLEGLTINYYIRNTNYSDTLLQMGRWFGYRPGYIDCCKLFVTSEAVRKFDSTTRSIEELEIEFEKMNRLNKSPRDFELRVRKHPGTLKITRPSILKNTKKIKWSYQDQLVQSSRFQINDTKRLKESWDGLQRFAILHKAQITDDKRFYVLDLDYKQVSEFLNSPNTFVDFDQEYVNKFIKICGESNKLVRWTIAIKAKGDSQMRMNFIGDQNNSIQFVIRSGPSPEKPSERSMFLNEGIFSASGKSSNIASGNDFNILLSINEREKAIADFRTERKEYYRTKGKLDFEERALTVNIPERVYRERMSDDRGLIVVYLIDINSVFRQNETDDELKEYYNKLKIEPNVPLIGYAIAFPPLNPDPGGEYVTGDYILEGDDDDDEIDEWDYKLESTED